MREIETETPCASKASPSAERSKLDAVVIVNAIACISCNVNVSSLVEAKIARCVVALGIVFTTAFCFKREEVFAPDHEKNGAGMRRKNAGNDMALPYSLDFATSSP